MSDADPPPLILYVDDERPNRIVFEQSLIGDFHVKTAASARLALEVLEQQEVAVLVTDMRMPEMTGDQLLRIAKEKWPNTIRVVITAYSDIEPILLAINEGLVARYVVKPWDLTELVQLLRWCLEAYAFSRESAGLQRRLLETERLATLGGIAAAVVHDLNQPLAGLVINSERLEELAAAVPSLRRALDGSPMSHADRERIGELVDELADLSHDLRESAHHLRAVTNGLGQYLYPKQAPAAAPATDALPIVRNAMAVCRDIAVRARGHIAYDGPPQLPKVRVPATELTQVLINLVSNAVQALAARGEPNGHVTVVARVDGQMLVVQVRDEGIGMTPEVLARVGTPFFTTRREGIGLGLAQCQRLVGKAGGTFRIDSEVGVGTTVTMALPIAN
jgi:two-component system NtrC family sensor kinase